MWAAVWLIDGCEPDWLPDRTLRRLRGRLREVRAEELRGRVADIAPSRSYGADAALVGSVLAEPGLIVGGDLAGRHHGRAGGGDGTVELWLTRPAARAWSGGTDWRPVVTWCSEQYKGRGDFHPVSATSR